MKKSVFAMLLIASLADVAARAQTMTNPVQDYINKTTLLNNILSNKRATGMSQKAQTRGKSPNRGAVVAAGRADSGATLDPTTFSRTDRPLLPALLAGKSGGANRDEAERFFDSLLRLYEETARKDGFPSNDLAYAFEYFVVNSYLTYHDLHDVPYDKDPRVKRGRDSFDRITIINEKKLLKVTPHQERAIYEQFKNLLADNAEVRKMTDRQKQELTELLAITFGVSYSAYLKGVNGDDERLAEQASQAAKGYLEKLIGAPVGRIKIGNKGLEM